MFSARNEHRSTNIDISCIISRQNTKNLWGPVAVINARGHSLQTQNFVISSRGLFISILLLFLFSGREKSSQDSLRVCSLISLVLSPRIPYKISHNSPMFLYLCIKTSSPEIHFVMLFDVFLLPSSPYSFGSTIATAIFPMHASNPSRML